MPLYFFDTDDGKLVRDDTGIECSNLDVARQEAKRALPDMARDVLPSDGEQHALSVTVRDDQDHTVYTASLMFSGLTSDMRACP